MTNHDISVTSSAELWVTIKVAEHPVIIVREDGEDVVIEDADMTPITIQRHCLVHLINALCDIEEVRMSRLGGL